MHSKCGRVVCSACSPHRITIPHRYIVRPPLHSQNHDRSESIDQGGLVSPNLSGGERVRLCNPCVPDPNIAPPQVNQTGHGEQQPYHSRTMSSADSITSQHSRRGHRTSTEDQDASPGPSGSETLRAFRDNLVQQHMLGTNSAGTGESRSRSSTVSDKRGNGWLCC